jgi:hypothetical protein
MFYGWQPYVSVAERKRKAEREIAKSQKKGTAMTPVVIAGRAIATTFWGKAWCQNIERYSDYANRLPRGRSYVRNRAVLDLHIADGVVKALVMGSRRCRRRTGTPSAKIVRAQSIHWSSYCGGASPSTSWSVSAGPAPVCFPYPKTSTSPAPARTGHPCANTSRRYSTASAHVSTNNRNYCSRSARWTKKTSSPKPGKACPCRVKHPKPAGHSKTQNWPMSSASRWRK